MGLQRKSGVILSGRFPQPHPRPLAVLRHEDDTSGFEGGADGPLIALPITQQSSSPIVCQVGTADHRQPHPLFGQYRPSPFIIEPALLAARNSGRGNAAVEEWHGLAVLALVILHHKAQLGIEGIHRKPDASPVPAGIAQEKREAPLPERFHPEEMIAQVDHVGFVTVGAGCHGYFGF